MTVQAAPAVPQQVAGMRWIPADTLDTDPVEFARLVAEAVAQARATAREAGLPEVVHVQVSVELPPDLTGGL